MSDKHHYIYIARFHLFYNPVAIGIGEVVFARRQHMDVESAIVDNREHLLRI